MEQDKGSQQKDKEPLNKPCLSYHKYKDVFGRTVEINPEAKKQPTTLKREREDDVVTRATKKPKTNEELFALGRKTLTNFLNEVLPEDKKKFLKENIMSVPDWEFDRQWRERVMPVWKIPRFGTVLVVKRMLALSEIDIKEIGSSVEEGKRLLTKFHSMLDAFCKLVNSLAPLPTQEDEPDKN